MKVVNTGTVYALRCNANGKMYIGSTAGLDSRLHEHMAALSNNKHPNKSMQEDYNKYSGDFSVAVLADYLPSDKVIRKIEALYMTIYKTRNPDKGYNNFDITNDEQIEKLKFYPISTNPIDGIYDPRKRRRKNLVNPARTQFYFAREKAGMTSAEFARALGVTRQAVSLWELGITKPRADILKKAADLIGVPMETLLTSEQEATNAAQ